MLGFFKANVLFKQFQPAGPADRVLVYLTLYTTQALAKCVSCETAPAALKALTAMAHENFKIPGDGGFSLGTFYPSPEGPQESGASLPVLPGPPHHSASFRTGPVVRRRWTEPSCLAAAQTCAAPT